MLTINENSRSPFFQKLEQEEENEKKIPTHSRKILTKHSKRFNYEKFFEIHFFNLYIKKKYRDIYLKIKKNMFFQNMFYFYNSSHTYT